MSTVTNNAFHEGELAVQQRAGATAQGQNSGRMISEKIIPGAIKFVRKQPFVVIGSIDDAENVWASIVVGQTGLMVAESQSLDIDVSQIQRLESDPVWSNLASNPQIGMLVIDLRSRARLRVNGQASFRTNDQLHVENSLPGSTEFLDYSPHNPAFIDRSKPINDEALSITPRDEIS